MSRISVRLAVLVLLAVSPLSAQTASARARAFFQAHTDTQWVAMADFVDSASLHAMRGVADTLVGRAELTSNPDFLRATADSAGLGGLGQMLSGFQSMFGASLLGTTFARVSSADELRAMSDRELMARWFEAKSFSYATSMVMGTMFKGLMDNLPGAAATDLQAALSGVTSTPIAWQVIGEIAEGDSVSHVAYRVAGQTPTGPIGVLSFKKSAGKWYIHFTDPDDQLAQMSALAMSAIQARLPRGGG